MERPKNYDRVSSSSWTPVEVGGHFMRIMNAEIKINQKGGEMIVVSFDFNKGDKQEGYFMNEYKNSTKEPKKWDFCGQKYINILDSNTGDCSKGFKKFCTCVERSNNGFIVQFTDENDNELRNDVFCAQFMGKLVGGVFGLVESEYNGNVRKRPELRWFCEYSKVQEQNAPDEQLLKNRNASKGYRPQQQTSVSTISRPQTGGTTTSNVPQIDPKDILF